MIKPDDQSSRGKILAAAEELIIDVGWANITTRSIAERAGVNNALIHYYFGSKDALLLEAASAAFAEAQGPLPSLADAPSTAEALKSLFSWLASVDAHSPMMIISMEAAHQAIRDEAVAGFLKGIWDQYFGGLTSLIEAAQARGEFREDLDAMGTAVAFGALLDGLFLYRLLSADVSKASSVVATLIDSLGKEEQ
jgi:AcrR family transcriptional regulator